MASPTKKTVTKAATSPTKDQIESKPMEMDFYDALKAIAEGKKVTRVEWGDPTINCFLARPGDAHLKIFINGAARDWIVTEGDMIGTDWIIV